jgi:ketosteroid isomerase-like protein
MRKNRRAKVLLADSLASYRQVPVDEAKIREIRAESNRAIAARDVVGVSASLADDFVVVIGDGTFLTREKYLAAFEHGFEQPSPLSYERVADEIRLSDALPLAAERGHWTGRLDDGRILFTGAYSAMWRRTAAGWKLRSELFVLLTHEEKLARVSSET